MPNLPWTHRTLYQLTVQGLAFGQQIVNTHHFEAEATYDITNNGTDAGAQADSQLLALDWIANLKTPYLAQLPVDYAMQNVICQVLERNGQFRHRLTPMENVSTGPGTNATLGTLENLTLAGVIRWRTPIAGKRHRGRSYIGPLGQSAVADGRLVTGAVTVLTAYADAMRNRYTGAGASAGKWNLTVYSRPYNSGEYQYTVRDSSGLHVVTPPDYAGDSTFVTTTSIDNTARVQRRRELGVGS